MMIEIAFAMLLGIIAGCLAGLLPGLHPNLFASLILLYFYGLDPFVLAAFLLCSGIANSFISFIPSILLGAPESESSLSVLPGHRLLLKGRGYEAIKLTVIGGMIGGLAVLALLPFLFFLSIWYEKFKILIAVGLLLISSYMILSEEGKRKIIALYVFLFSGLMGLNFLNAELLFPVFTGFFGLPLLFLSWIKETKLPEKISFEEEKIKHYPGALIGLASGILAGLFPGISSAQASMIAQEILRKKGDRDFLISMGTITTVDVILSILAIYIIQNPRSGIAQAIMETLGNFSLEICLFLVLVSVFAVLISGYLTLKLAKEIIFLVYKIEYKAFCRTMLFFVIFLVFLLTGAFGLIVCMLSFFLGLFTNLSKIKRTNLMGFLIIPTLLYYL